MGRGSCRLRERRHVGQDVERVRSLPAVCVGLLQRGGASRRRKLQQVPLGAAELGSEGGSGCAVVAGVHADLRAVVGLQAHGGNIAHFIVAPVQ